MSVDTVLETLQENGKISPSQAVSVREFIAANQVKDNTIIDPIEDIVLRLHDIGQSLILQLINRISDEKKLVCDYH